MPNEESTIVNDSSNDSVIELLKKIQFKKISEFPKLEELTDNDTLILVDDALGIVGRVTAKELMAWFNDNLKNFICWRPIVEDNTLKWVRDKLDKAPADLKFTDIIFPMASETENGMIDPDMYNIIQKLMSTYDTLVTNDQLEEGLNTKSDKDHVHDQYATNDALQNLKNDIIDADYVRNALLEELVKSKGFIKISDIKSVSESNDGLMTSKLLAQLNKNTEDLKDTAKKDHTHDQYLDEDEVQKIVDKSIPTKVSDLENDEGYVRSDDIQHPKASADTAGIVMVPDDSAIVVDNNTQAIDVKPFNVQNMLANTDFSTYATVNSAIEFDSWFKYPTDDAAMSMEPIEGNGALNSYAKCHLFNGTGFGQRIKDINTVPTAVTVSFYAYASAEKHISVMLFGLAAEITLSTSWNLYVVKFKNPATTIADTNDIFAVTGSDSDADNVDVYITHIMCQRGNIPTGWCRYQMDVIPVEALPKASANKYGIIKPDGTTITVDANGIAHASTSIDGKIIAVIDDSADGDPSVTWSSFLIGDKFNTLSQNLGNTNASVINVENAVGAMADTIAEINNILPDKCENIKIEDGVLYLLGTPTLLDDGTYEENILASATITATGSGDVIKKSVIPSEDTTDITRPTEFDKLTNILVYYNGILMEENTNYTLLDDKISAIGFKFAKDSIITFIGGNSNDAINLNTPADQITISDPDNLFDGATSVEGGMKVMAKKIKAITPSVLTITLSSGKWSNNTQSVEVTAVTADNTVIINPSYDSQLSYCECGIYCISQKEGSLTFECTSTPLEDISINTIIF